MAYKTKAEYAKDRLDPRWQKRRLEIMQRDHFACLLCGSKDKTLNVHHVYYRDNPEGPWDYPDAALKTLCQECHKEEGPAQKAAIARMVRAMQRAGMWNAESFDAMAEAFEHVKPFEEFRGLEDFYLTATIGTMLWGRAAWFERERGIDISDQNVDPDDWFIRMWNLGFIGQKPFVKK